MDNDDDDDDDEKARVHGEMIVWSSGITQFCSFTI